MKTTLTPNLLAAALVGALAATSPVEECNRVLRIGAKSNLFGVRAC